MTPDATNETEESAETTEPPDWQAEVLAESADDTPAPEPEPELAPVFEPPGEGKPLSATVDGRDLPIVGALRYDHGVYIPTASMPQLERHLADREGFDRRLSQLQHQSEQREAETPAAIARADLISKNADYLARNPEAMEQFLADFNDPALKQQFENVGLRKQLQAWDDERAAADQALYEEQFDAAVPDHLDRAFPLAMAEMPELGALSEYAKEAKDWLYENRGMFYANHQDGGRIIRRDRLFPMLQRAALIVAEAKRKYPPTPTAAPPKPTPVATVSSRDWQEELLAIRLDD